MKGLVTYAEEGAMPRKELESCRRRCLYRRRGSYAGGYDVPEDGAQVAPRGEVSFPACSA